MKQRTMKGARPGVGVVTGAGIGMIVGAVFDDPGTGLVLGAAVGLAAGVFTRRSGRDGSSDEEGADR